MRRYAVYFRVESGAELAGAEISEEPVETLRLPLTKERAQLWLLEHFEDFEPARARGLIARLVRPTGATARRTTDPLT